MNKSAYLLALALAGLMSAPLGAQEADTGSETEAAAAPEATAEDLSQTVAAVDPNQPRSMSGMSILGNEEAPKALVIIPWKSSELGDEIGMPENSDDRATPVDKDVFLRELRFYEIRNGDTHDTP